jgi:5-amino-6-(5-phospho-D-ribitylamino)uracil phosphatase
MAPMSSLRDRRASPLTRVRLVALDLDGTLLPESKVLTDRAIGVVRDLRAAGVEVTLATGKGWNLTRRYAEDLGLTAPLVALDGALVARLDAEPLRRRTLSTSTLRTVDDAVRDLDVGFMYCHEGLRLAAHRRLERWLPQIRIWDPHVDMVECRAGDETSPHAAFGFTLVGPPAAVADARRRVEALAPIDVDLLHAEFWGGHHQLHLRPVGVDKRSGLDHVLRDLGASWSEVLAAGDWWNDVAMLEAAGVAVATANALEGVRAVADHVLPRTCEEDGLARFLEDALATL